VRRKTLSAYNMIVEATKVSGKVMAIQMRDMATASCDLERSKIEVQLKLFLEQMEYQRKKDRRLYENSLIANENARLAILKQGEVVSCLAQLSNVLQIGLNVSPAGTKSTTATTTPSTTTSMPSPASAPSTSTETCPPDTLTES
jgi:hypothetical protein